MNRFIKKQLSRKISVFNISFNIIVFSLIVILVSLLTQCTYTKADNSNNFITEERNIELFNKLNISGAFDISIAQGENQQVSITAEESTIKLVITEVKNNTLYISLKKDFNNHNKIAIKLVVQNLQSIVSTGASNIKGLNKITTSNLNLDLSGASDISFDIDVENLNIEISGASDMVLIGNVIKNNLKVSGTANIDAVKLNSKKTQISISGSGDAKINVDEEIIIDASGVSNVFYKGNPTKKIINTQGLSTVKKI